MVDPELEFKIEKLDELLNHWKRFFHLYRKIQQPGGATPKVSSSVPSEL